MDYWEFRQRCDQIIAIKEFGRNLDLTKIHLYNSKNESAWTDLFLILMRKFWTEVKVIYEDEVFHDDEFKCQLVLRSKELGRHIKLFNIISKLYPNISSYSKLKYSDCKLGMINDCLVAINRDFGSESYDNYIDYQGYFCAVYCFYSYADIAQIDVLNWSKNLMQHAQEGIRFMRNHIQLIIK